MCMPCASAAASHHPATRLWTLDFGLYLGWRLETLGVWNVLDIATKWHAVLAAAAAVTKDERWQAPIGFTTAAARVDCRSSHSHGGQ